MSNNTAPRIPRDRLSPGQALLALLTLAFCGWALIYLLAEAALKLARR